MINIVMEAGYHGYIGIEYEGNNLSEHDGIIATKALLENVRRNINLLEQKEVIIQSFFKEILEFPSIMFEDKNIRKLFEKKHPFPHWYFQSLVNEVSPLHLKYVNTTINETKGYHLIYQMGEPPDYGHEALLLAKRTGYPLTTLIQEYPYKAKSTKYYMKSLLSKYTHILPSFVMEAASFPFTYGLYRKLPRSVVVKGMLIISQACFQNRGIHRNLLKKGIPSIALNHPGAIESLDHVKHGKKEDYVIYYARMVPEKGIFEIPEIAKELGNDIKILIYGKFPNKTTEINFKQLISNNKNIVYGGFADREELLDRICKAKVVIYPSHADAFSLVILEALSLGTPVVAYKIPGLIQYQVLPAVSLVKEFDYYTMAKEIKEFLDMPDAEYHSLINNEKVQLFIRDHKSWKDLTEEEILQLENILNGDMERIRSIPWQPT
jgi:glycosyltransferase involved in cell wall biosynthesis